MFRPVNFVITFISGILAVLIAQGGVYSDTVLYHGILVGIAAALVGAGGNIINDILDVETDKINRPDRPIPSGKVSETTAMRIYIFVKIGGIFFASIAGIFPGIIAAFSSIIIFFYSYSLKNIPLVGNITVAFFTGLIFVFGASAVGNFSGILFPFLFSFFINFIREIVKDVEDIEGDRETEVHTFPIVFGIETSKKIITGLIFSLTVLTFIPFFLAVYKIEYLIIIALSVSPGLVTCAKAIKKAEIKEDYSKISKNLKLIMALGIVAILFGL